MNKNRLVILFFVAVITAVTVSSLSVQGMSQVAAQGETESEFVSLSYAVTNGSRSIVIGTINPQEDSTITLHFYESDFWTDNPNDTGGTECIATGQSLGQVVVSSDSQISETGQLRFAVSTDNLPQGTMVIATSGKTGGNLSGQPACLKVTASGSVFNIANVYQDVVYLNADGKLTQGIGISLVSKLDAALDRTANGYITSAINQLHGFRTEVNVLTQNDSLGFNTGMVLLDGANRAILDLGGHPLVPGNGESLPKPGDGPSTVVSPGDIYPVRSNDGGYFMNRETGGIFTPRGINLTTYPYHTMLDPDHFNPAFIESTLAMMNLYGYNVIRVFINHNPGGIGDSDGTGLSPAYIENIYTLLELSARYDVYVIFALEWRPAVEPYVSLFGDPGPNFYGQNAELLTSGGHVSNVAFASDFVGEVSRAPDAAHVFGYEIRNEFFFDLTSQPFEYDQPDLPPRIVTTADGNTYSIEAADRDEARYMMVSNSLLFLDRVIGAIKAANPDAMVSAGLVTPRSRIYGKESLAKELIVADKFDFLDLHVYPHEYFNTYGDYLTDFGIDGLVMDMPVLIGEMGVTRGTYSATALTWFGYDDDLDAAGDLVDWQVASCEAGADGWLTWAWDATDATDDVIDLFYTAVADIRAGDRPAVWVAPVGTEPDPDATYMGLVGYMLAPAFRPDPCSADGVVPVLTP